MNVPHDTEPDALLRMLNSESVNVLIVRHGQAGGNGTIEGYDGSALSPLGEQQAVLLATRLAGLPLDCLYASNLARAHQTAMAVREYHPGIPCHSLSELREIAAIHARGRKPARTREDRQRLHEERERVARFARRLRRDHCPGELIAIIAHNGLKGMLLAELTGVPYRHCMFIHACHTGVTLANVYPEPGRVVLRLMGCIRHLPAAMVTADNVPSQA